jgi:hypothetical protein
VTRIEAVAEPAPVPVEPTVAQDRVAVAPVSRPVAAKRVRVTDPCAEGFRPIRSKYKRPKGSIMKTRKPAYDPCKGRYKPIKVNAIAPANSEVAAGSKRMCFEGGELKPC